MYYSGYEKEDSVKGVPIKTLGRFRRVLDKFKEETVLTQQEVLHLLEQDMDILPVAIFSNRRLGVLEIIVKYMREELDYSLNKIAGLLKRDNRTVWSSYCQSKKKDPEQIVVDKHEFLIPVALFANRELGVLEVLVSYLRDRYGLKYSEIGELLSRDQRTIWTVYNRKLRKTNGKQEKD